MTILFQGFGDVGRMASIQKQILRQLFANSTKKVAIVEDIGGHFSLSTALLESHLILIYQYHRRVEKNLFILIFLDVGTNFAL